MGVLLIRAEVSVTLARIKGPHLRGPFLVRHVDRFVVNGGGVETEDGFAEAARDALEHFGAGGDGAPGAGL